MSKVVFTRFITEYFPEDQEHILLKFEEYHRSLVEVNRFVNLVSRKTSDDEIWTKHFLDSILPAGKFDFIGKRILDFGTGGGMPGIPLKIVFPTSQVYLMDSRNKKIDALKKIIKKLDLSGCFTIVSRLEEMDHSWNGYFDMIVCRSVKILPKYRKILLRLLKDGGEILFYKSKVLDDMGVFKKTRILDLSHQAIGERKIVQIKKKWEGHE